MFDDALSYLRSRSGRLALTYFGIIAALTLMFSIILFGVVSSRLTRPPEPIGPGSQFRTERSRAEALLRERVDEARADLFLTFIMFNILIDILGAVVSFYLAQATMKPIEDSVEAQARFVSDASHELRTPLTALQTANEVALRGKNLKLKDAREVIEYNLSEVVKLRELTNALLGLARNEGALVRESFNIQEAMSEALQPIVPLAQQKRIAIDDGVTKQIVHANLTATTQIIRILLENAVKYSPEKTVVNVRVEPHKTHVDLLIQDQGIGIEKHLHTQIFERFYRVDESRSSAESGGFGLGLAIASDLARRQGIAVFVKDSSQEQGTTFCVRFSRS